MNVTPLISPETIAQRVETLADALSRRYAGREIVLLVVLKGGIVFAADLMRRMTIPVLVDFIRARSYEGTASNGPVALGYLPETPLAGRDVVVVEDILDTGRTSQAILEWVRGQGAASAAVCVLLDKPSRRRVDIEADFAGMVIGDHFVVGYGLDYEQQGRQHPGIGILNAAD
ncbi:MAG TPA: hypoxanthine phosphoribosyltransferase [Candidatus Hydrogenedentes bacterium]|nr:hypoxanthine phosphoribosyltransferase [Candidatus Hydrogenedentota bacterium]